MTRIGPLLKKKPWSRLVHKDYRRTPIIDPDYYDIPEYYDDVFGELTFQYLGNAELYNESRGGAHLINSNIYSTRPVYEVIEREIEVIGDDGIVYKKPIKEEVIVGYDPVETVRSGLPEMIISQKASHLGKNGIEIADERGKDREAFDILRSYKDACGIDTAWIELLRLAGSVGDAAVVFHQEGDRIKYSIFSFENGDMLFPHKDNKGRDMLVRLYSLQGRKTVDIYTTREKSTWVQGDISKEESTHPGGLRDWLKRIWGWFRNPSLKVSEDGWTRIDYSESQLGGDVPQFAYLRFRDSFIGVAMQNIDALDRGLSYTSDKMRSTAFSKLLVKAFSIKNLPPTSSGEEVIGIEGDAEQLKASDVKHVAPPDISNIAPLNIKNIHDAIMEATMSVDLPPEILKSGADSSQTLKILLRREIQWCHVMWPSAYTTAQRIIEILQAFVDKIKGGHGRFTDLLVSIWNTPWLPQDEDALADRMCKLSYASLVSQTNGRRELNLQYTDDEELIRKEQEEKIFRETYIKLKAEAQAAKDFGIVNTNTDPAKTPDRSGADDVDNNAPNK